MSVKMKFGSKDIPFVYKGNKLVYPNPIKDGLLLWYDFKGMRNTDTNKEVAKDLSGNGNDGTLTNFNFTEGSGYKDNTLVFDGVDDRLTIPELALGETSMSVVHDGKIYSYEDDKVLTVGEDGEIVGSGKNLLLSSDIPQSSSEYILANYTYAEKLELDEPFTATIKVKLGEGAQYPRFYNTGGHVSGAFAIPSKIKEFSDGTTIWTISGTWKIANAGNDFLRVYQTALNDTYPVSTVEWCKLERGTTETPHAPASSDYKTTTLTPTSLTDLQLYNKTLRKDELLHNAESKGLKKLKPGVVVQDGLMLHYDFSHESNTSEYKDKAFDYSGNGNHGVLNNFNFTEESGYAEDGLKFDGVDDEVKFTNILSEQTAENQRWSVEFVGHANSLSDRMYVVRLWNAGLEFRRTPDGKLRALNFTNNSGFIYSTHLFNLMEKVHVVYSYDYESATASVTVNGYNTNTRVNEMDYRPSGIHSSLTMLGYQSNITFNSFKVYNRPLTPEEIAHNYQIEKEKFNITEGEM